MKMKGTQILLECLKAEGVDVMFGYPGGSVIDIYDELHRNPAVRHILVRHEQAAVHAADGYARATGKVGVALATSGPGATNTVTGIATANMDSIPIVVFTGQVPTHLIGNDAFQECDITGITRPCTKHNYLVRNPDELASTIREAFHIARSGRPGPVLVDLPKNVIAAEVDYDPARIRINATKLSLPSKPSPKKYVQLLEMLRASRRPLLMTGGGILLGKATDELRSFARRAKLPVTSTLMGLGAFPGSDPLFLGMPGMHGTYFANMAISHCDLLICIGARFDDRVTGKIDTFAPNAQIIHIDVDPSSINKNIVVDLPIVSDARGALENINRLLKDNNYTATDAERKDWLDEIAGWKKKAPLSYCQDAQHIKPQCVVETLHELTKGKAIITTEVGQNQMWACQYYKCVRPRQFLTSSGLGTMGYGFPAAIGAQLGNPDKVVVDIAGDGSIQMCIQELATAVVHQLPVKIVILNNSCLGMVRQWQDLFYDKRYSGTLLTGNPDFVKLAEAYGAAGFKVDRKEDVRATLEKSLEITDRPTIMDFRIPGEENVYPMIPAGKTFDDMMETAPVGV